MSIGVGGYDRRERLDFAPGLARRLGQALGALGYQVSTVAEERLPGAELGGHVHHALDAGGPDDLAVVHLVAHGERADGDATVFALGSDGAPHRDTSVAHWLTMQEAGTRPQALFLLDLCSAGLSARLPWQPRAGAPARGWVIAACGPDEAAYDGRFTRAVITVLEALRAGELDIDPGVPHVPLSAVARAIRQEVNRLADADDAYPQQVTASLVDISADGDPPFFPNPAYDPTPGRRLRAGVDAGLLPFLDDLDEGLDARHFLERATGLGRLTETGGLVGCFTGRDRELRLISPWLNGDGDHDLRVVTGSPGSGKSALLGVLVCAASPALREATRPVWGRVAQFPLPVPDLAAVHARQRGVAAVTASVARQLGLPENAPPAALVAALRARDRRPVLVVDALDEADDPTALMEQLLLPLTAPGRPVRLLVGVRRYDEFAPLFERGRLHDLDDVEESVLEDDLLDYVIRLLRTVPEYRAGGGVTGAFAQAVAHALAAPGEGGRHWGPFLVAGLYTRHFVAAYADDVVTDPEVAAELGRAVPADLRGVLELDLALAHDQPWLRPVLRALAAARGAGMPVSVLARVAPRFAPDLPPPTAGQVRAALAAARFYLRQSMDTDRSNLYRLFHQGLADTLASGSAWEAGVVLDGLLSSLGPEGARDWTAAEPYLFRHVAAYAAAAGRAEVVDDPGLVLHPDWPRDPRFAGVTTPAELAMAAARAGEVALARRAANAVGQPPLPWQPRWAIGTREPARVRVAGTATEPGLNLSVTISADGSTAAAVGADGATLWSWPEHGQPEAEAVWHTAVGEIVALALDGGLCVVADRDQVRGLADGRPTLLEDVPAVEAALPIGSSTFLCVTYDGVLCLYDHRQPRLARLADMGHPGGSWALGYTIDHVPVAMALNKGGQLVRFDPAKQKWSLLGSARGLTALACDPRGTRVVVADADGLVRSSSLTGEVAWQRVKRFDSPPTALAVTSSGTVVAGCRNGVVHIVRDDGHDSIHVSAAEITAIALDETGDRVVALDQEGGVSFYDHTMRELVGRHPDTTLVVGSRKGADDVEPAAVTAFILEEDTLLAGFANGVVAGLDERTGRLEAELHTSAVPTGFARVALGTQEGLVIGTADRHLLVADDGNARHELGNSEWARARLVRQPATHLVVDGRFVEVGCANDRVVLDSRDLGEPLKVDLGAHPGGGEVHCTHVDGRPTAFTGGTDGCVRVWDLTDRCLVHTIDIGSSPVWRIEYVGGETLLVGAGGELWWFDRESA